MSRPISESLSLLSETLGNCKTNLKEKEVADVDNIKISDVDEKIAEIQAGGGSSSSFNFFEKVWIEELPEKTTDSSGFIYINTVSGKTFTIKAKTKADLKTNTCYDFHGFTLKDDYGKSNSLTFEPDDWTLNGNTEYTYTFDYEDRGTFVIIGAEGSTNIDIRVPTEIDYVVFYFNYIS